jgi:hypothetical protein
MFVWNCKLSDVVLRVHIIETVEDRRENFHIAVSRSEVLKILFACCSVRTRERGVITFSA